MRFLWISRETLRLLELGDTLGLVWVRVLPADPEGKQKKILFSHWPVIMAERTCAWVVGALGELSTL